MSKQMLKKIAVIIGALLLLLVLVVGYLAATFNPNDYKQQVIDLVKEKKQRTLTIEGNIQLSFWPKIGADLGKVSISEYQSDKVFASINSAKVALAVLPLLKKEVVVDTVYLDGAQANVVKRADGTFNFDDLLSKEEEESEQIKFDVQGIKISNTALTYLDEAANSQYQISNFNLSTGAVALGKAFDLASDFNIKANQPVVDAKASLKANVMADPEAQHFAVKALDAEVKGVLLGGKQVTVTALGDVEAKLATQMFDVSKLKLALTGDFNGVQQQASVEAPLIKVTKEQVNSQAITLSVSQKGAKGQLSANIKLADMTGNPQAVKSSGVTAEIQQSAGKRSLNGRFSSPFSANITQQIYEIPKLAGQFHIQDPAVPNGKLDGQFNLSAKVDVKQEQASTQFKLDLLDTKLDGQVAVSQFKTPHIQFKLNADKLDLNHLLGQSAPAEKTASTSNSQPADLSALKTLFLDGTVNIGQILYNPYKVSNLNVAIKADGQQLALSGLDVKVDDTHIKGNLGISQFSKPLYTFNLDIDQVDLNRYLPASEAKPTANKADTASTAEQAIDLSPLKALNAQGNIRVGQLKYGKTQASNLNIGLKAQNGIANLAPMDVNVYQGSIKGAVKVDARNTPQISIQQQMSNIAIGPLLVDTINNDMLSGRGSVSLDVSTQGSTVSALKKSLNGSAAMQLADGAVKGIDIAGTIRDAKGKLNLLKGQANTVADDSKKTDFSELTASFAIKNGVAHNEDLAMKAPVIRLTKGDSKGDIDIGNEQINYVAKPTLVATSKGQGGKEADEVAGIGIPIKITGSFASPKFGMDMAALGQALAKSAMLDKLMGDKLGDKAGLAKGLLNGENKTDAVKNALGGLLDRKAKGNESAPAEGGESQASPTENIKEKALKNLLKF